MDCSILIATRNRADSLARTLRSLAAMDTGALQWEVLVADNGSNDDTPAVLSEMAQRLPLRALTVPEPGKNRALNKLLETAQGALLVFTDDDVEVDPNWLSALHAAYTRQTEGVMLAGRIVPVFPPQAPSWMTAPNYRFAGPAFARFDFGDEERVIDATAFGPSFALAATMMEGRSFDERVGPQPGDYITGGETVLLRSIAQDGHRTVYVPSAVVSHYVRREQLTVEYLNSRAYQLGRGGAYTAQLQRQSAQGVPWRMWFKLARAWLRYRLTFWRDDAARARRAETYFHRLGFVHQTRKQSLRGDAA